MRAYALALGGKFVGCGGAWVIAYYPHTYPTHSYTTTTQRHHRHKRQRRNHGWLPHTYSLTHTTTTQRQQHQHQRQLTHHHDPTSGLAPLPAQQGDGRPAAPVPQVRVGEPRDAAAPAGGGAGHARGKYVDNWFDFGPGRRGGTRARWVGLIHNPNPPQAPLPAHTTRPTDHSPPPPLPPDRP